MNLKPWGKPTSREVPSVEYSRYQTVQKKSLPVGVIVNVILGVALICLLAYVLLGRSGVIRQTPISKSIQAIAEFYEETATKAESGDFKDLLEMGPYIEANVNEIRSQTLEPYSKKYESINGEKWTNSAAGKVLRSIAKDHRQCK